MEEKQEQVVQEVEQNVSETEVVAENADGTVAATPDGKPKNKFISGMDKFFGISKSGSNFRTEIMAGVTTFMAMAYILVVNPSILSATNGALNSAFYIATALGAIVGTLMMSLYAKYPFAQAPGMGLNAFFAFTIVGVGCANMSVENGLFIILISGILFLILTLVGVREKIVESIPKSVRQAIPVGIGLFIAFLGLQNCGAIVADASTLVKLQSFNVFADGFVFAKVYPIIITLITFIAIAVMSKLKVRGAMLWGILGGSVIYYVFGYAGGFGGVANFPNWGAMLVNPGDAFASWGKDLVGQVFVSGWNFAGQNAADVALVIITGVLSFAMVDMFDTIGTLLGTAQRANMLDENGTLPRMKQALLADSVATCAGAIFGTTTVTTFVESSAGVAEGGRTGLTSLVTAGLFFLAMFLTPLAQIIPGCATAAALIYVGVLMMASVKNIDFTDAAAAVPAFLTISMMAFTYNISYGIGLGLISHCLIMLGTGKYFGIGKEFVKKAKAVVAVVAPADENVVEGSDVVAESEVTIDSEKEENAESGLLPKTYYLKKEYVTIIISVIFILLFIFTH